MKNIFFCLLACCFALQAQAQQKNNEEAAIQKMWKSVWQAYEKSDEAAMWAAYADDACEVFPDGTSLCGKQALKAGYDQFKDMLDGQPKWTYTAPEIHFVEPNVALLLSDITSDMKLKGGQQIGGKMKFTAVLHKVKGQWLIVYDGQTPVMQAPGN